jgi:hypothetical protein
VTFRALAAITALALSASAPAFAEPVFVNGITVPANTLDLSGDPITLNQRVGMFSDLYYDPIRNEWWGLSDRGAGGGTLPYDTRVQRFTVDVNPSTGAISNFQVVQTVKFTDATGTLPFNGLAPSPTNVLGRSLDPEGFVVNPKTGRFLVSDEYGPSLYEFNRDGTLARTFTTPASLIGRNATVTPNVPNFADDTGNTAGKRTNRGFEGLAITPDGKFTFAMLQSPMLDEGGLGNGRYNRIVKFDNATGLAVAQYAYLMEGSSQGRGISALVALNDHEFLVLERNNRGVGVASELTPPNKKVYKIDITGASDVSEITLPDSGALPGGRLPVTKTATPFISLDANTLAAFGGRVPEKWEGLAIGPRLADGQYVILAGTDNDFSVTQNAGSTTQFDVFYNPATGARIQCDIGTFADCFSINADGTLGAAFSGSTSGFDLIPGLLYAFKSTGSDLASFVAPAASVPLPGTSTLLLAGLSLVALAMRRRNT